MPTVSNPLTVALTGWTGSKVESSRPRQDRTNSRVCVRYASESSKLSHCERLSPSTSTHMERYIISANVIVQPCPAGTYRRPKQTTTIYRLSQLSTPVRWSEKPTQTDIKVTVFNRSYLARGHNVEPKYPKSAALRLSSLELWLIVLTEFKTSIQGVWKLSA